MTSSDANIATGDVSGTTLTVTGVAAGSADITVSDGVDFTYTVEVTVTE